MNTRYLKPGQPYRVTSGRGSNGDVRKGDILMRSSKGVQYFPQGRGFPIPEGTPWFQIDRLTRECECEVEEIQQ